MGPQRVGCDWVTKHIYMEVPQKIKIELLYDPVIPLLGICVCVYIYIYIYIYIHTYIYLKEMKSTYQRDICTSVYIATLFTISMIRRQPNVHWWMNGKREYGIYTQWNINLFLKRKKKLLFTSTGKHYPKWNKIVTEGQILYDSTY